MATSLILTSAKVVGGYSFPDNFYVLVPDTDSSLGREVAIRIHEKYKNSVDSGSFEALKKSLVGEDKASVVVYVDDVLYAAVSGQTKVVVLRNGTLATIVEGKEGTITVSGYPKDKDYFLMGSKAYFEGLSEADVKQALLSGDIGSEGTIILGFGQEIPIPKKTLPFKFNVRPAFRDLEVPKTKRNVMSVGVILLILLLLSIGFGVRQNKINKEKAVYEGGISLAQHNLDEAQKMLTLDPLRSRELFLEGQKQLEQLTNQGIKNSALTDLNKKYQDSEGKILGLYTTSPQLFLDLGLISSDFKAHDMNISDGKIALFDVDKQVVITVDVVSKKAQIEAGSDQLTGTKLVAIYSDRLFAFKDDGVYELSDPPKKVVEYTYTNGSRLLTFAGNLYLLNKNTSEILRAAGSDNGFGILASWLAPGIKMDLANVSTWGIDGSIWLGTSGGKVVKITQGVPESFPDISKQINKIDAMFVGDETSGVYLLDRTVGKLLVFDKKGNFLAEYRSDVFKDTTSLVVSEATKQAILLTGSKLQVVELKHL